MVLVVRDGAPWIRPCLASLARQTHRRLGILAVDDGSTDGSGDLLESLLGPGRVIRLERSRGYPAGVARALESPLAAAADHLLLVHDDVVLAEDAVARLVEAASAEGVGVVGPKVLDLRDPLVLLDVGTGTDRFGYPATPLEEGEIDQGQYDAPREVLAVSSAGMLVARQVWSRVGPPDARLRPCHADVDLCWRARLAGFRVVVDPRAVVRHGAVGERGERRGARPGLARYHGERARVTAMLKNYRAPTLLWVLPAYLVQAILRILALAASRRFSHAGQVAAAVGWALLALPGTVRRRVRAQAARRVGDRDVMQFMAPAGMRLRRWVGRASAALFPARATPTDLDEEVPPVPVRERVGGLLSAHPVAAALSLSVVLALVAFRDVLLVAPLEGGVIPAFPRSALDLLRSFGQGWSPAGFGGPGGASPALVPLGLAGLVALGSGQALAWLLVVLTPFLAGASGYRAAMRLVGEPAPSLATGACVALSAVGLWAVSLGRVDVMVALITLPWLAARVAAPFGGPVPPVRWAVGTGVVLALAGSFLPQVWAPLALLALAWAATGRGVAGRARGLALALGAAAVAAALVFPFAARLLRAEGGGLADLGGAAAWSLLRLSPGPAPGSWVPAFFLPVAGALALALARGRERRGAWAWALGGTLAIPLAWMAAAGRLPGPLSEPAAFLALGAVSLSFLVGLGLAGGRGIETRAFGSRQVGLAALVVVVAGGLLLQAGSAARGGWAVGEDREPAAWPVVATSDPGLAFRVLWLGEVGGGPFPPPGGWPQGVVEAGAASVRYAVTGRDGAAVTGLGLPPAGPGYEELARRLRSVLAGRVRHGGSLLAPLGVAFVVAGPGDLPQAALDRLDTQLDLLLVQRAGGLLVYRNTRALPVAAAVPGAEARAAARSADVLAPAGIPVDEAVPLAPGPGGAFRGRVDLRAPGAVLVSTEFDERWKLQPADGEGSPPFPAFGWAVGFDAPAGTYAADVRFEGQGAWNLQLGAMAALWAAALLILRRREEARA